MAYLTEKDFQKLAEAVATDLVDNDVSLNDSISKLAQDMGLTQEQIQRLCEASNNTTFDKMFKSRDKTAEDRFVEFPVADATQILGDQIKQASFVTPEDAGLTLFEMRELQVVEKDGKQVKIATNFELRPEGGVKDEEVERACLKMRDHMYHEKLAADMHYRDTVQQLRSRFRRLYDVLPFEQFEKQAAALYGADATVPLSEIRQLLSLPEVEYNFEVLTKTAGVVDDTTWEMQLMQQAISHKSESKKLARCLEKLECIL